MHKFREALRLNSLGFSRRKIVGILNIAPTTVSKYVSAANAANVVWPLPDISDDILRKQIASVTEPVNKSLFAHPDCAYLHAELKRKGVTLLLLWEEYRRENGTSAYGYSRFCGFYRDFKKQLKCSMRQVHRAGEKLFVDYAGQTVPIIDQATGEIARAQIFVAVLGASNYTYAEATLTQSSVDWLGSHVRTFEFFCGVPEMVVPHNLKSGVNKACRYDPDLNQSYAELASHYGTVGLPARPYKPKDKAKVEVGVQIVERWILAVLRKRTFFSLHELNNAIAELLIALNQKPFKKLPGSRLSAFESIDKPALKPLPETRYEYAIWKVAKVNIDYHVEFEGHYYSVPCALIHKQIDLRVTAGTVACIYNNQQVALHVRSNKRGSHSTISAHMPKSHRAHLEWTPGKLLNWALSIDTATRDIVEYQLANKPHPEMGYRSSLGLLSLARRYGHERLEAACRRALAIASPSRKSVLSILQAGLDQQPLPQIPPHIEPIAPNHSNVRGADYYH